MIEEMLENIKVNKELRSGFNFSLAESPTTYKTNVGQRI